MPNQQLIDYISQSRQKGITDAQIRQELSSIGWSQSEIDEHLTTGLWKTGVNHLLLPFKGVTSWSDMPKKYHRILICLALAFVFLYFGYNFLLTIFVLILLFVALKKAGQKQVNLQLISDNGIKKCPHCQMDISSLADKCPYCQSKIPKPRSVYDGVKLVVTAMVIVFGFFWLLTLLPDDDSSSENEIIQPTPTSQSASAIQKISLEEIVANYDEYPHTEEIKTSGTIVYTRPRTGDSFIEESVVRIMDNDYIGIIFQVDEVAFDNLKIGQVIEVNGKLGAPVGSPVRNGVIIFASSVIIIEQAPILTPTPTPKLIKTPAPTPINYSSFQHIHVGDYVKNPPYYYGKPVKITSVFIKDFLAKGDRGGDTNRIDVLDGYSQVVVPDEMVLNIDNDSLYQKAISSLNKTDYINVYGVGEKSFDATSSSGGSLTLPVLKVLRLEKCGSIAYNNCENESTEVIFSQ